MDWNALLQKGAIEIGFDIYGRDEIDRLTKEFPPDSRDVQENGSAVYLFMTFDKKGCPIPFYAMGFWTYMAQIRTDASGYITGISLSVDNLEWLSNYSDMWRTAPFGADIYADSAKNVFSDFWLPGMKQKCTYVQNADRGSTKVQFYWHETPQMFKSCEAALKNLSFGFGLAAKKDEANQPLC